MGRHVRGSTECGGSLGDRTLHDEWIAFNDLPDLDDVVAVDVDTDLPVARVVPIVYCWTQGILNGVSAEQLFDLSAAKGRANGF